MERQRIRNNQNKFVKENELGENPLPNFETHCESIATEA